MQVRAGAAPVYEHLSSERQQQAFAQVLAQAGSSRTTVHPLEARYTSLHMRLLTHSVLQLCNTSVPPSLRPWLSPEEEQTLLAADSCCQTEHIMQLLQQAPLQVRSLCFASGSSAPSLHLA